MAVPRGLEPRDASSILAFLTEFMGILEGKVAVITGAGGGIGSALAKRLDAEKTTLILIDKEQSLLTSLARSLTPERHHYLMADLTDISQISNVTREVFEISPKINFLFNVAGIGVYKPVKTLEFKQWRDSINLNLNAPFYLLSALLPAFDIDSGIAPMVFNVGSGMGVKPTAGRSAYCASKFGLRGLSLSLYDELKPNIDVCLLTLGSVMDAFGSGGLQKRLKLQKKGKHYLSIEDVANKILEITKKPTREAEYVFYPNGY